MFTKRLLVVAMVCLGLIACGKLPKGGATAGIEKNVGGNTLTVSSGTFDEDQSVTLGAVSGGDVAGKFGARAATITLPSNEEITSAAEIVIGDGSVNVTPKKDIVVGLKDTVGLATTSSAIHQTTHHASAALPGNMAIFCQLYNLTSLGDLLNVTENVTQISGGVITFAFGEGRPMSGFICMLIVNNTSETVEAPEVKDNAGNVIPPSGAGGTSTGASGE